jgi:hypothetical protein
MSNVLDDYLRINKLKNYNDVNEYLISIRKAYSMLEKSAQADYKMSKPKLMTIIVDNLPESYAYVANRLRESFPQDLDSFQKKLVEFEAQNGLNKVTKFPSAFKVLEKVACWKCHEKGHISRDCPKKKKYAN